MTMGARTAAAVSLLVCLTASACGRRPTSMESGLMPFERDAGHALTLRYADLVNVDVRNVPLLMAFDELSRHGYVVETTHLLDATVMADLVSRGDVDVAMINNQTAWAAIVKGADIRTIAQYTAPTSVLAGRENIRSCGDLNHRRFGASSSSGMSPILFALYLDRHCPGTEPDAFVITQADARAAALLAGRIEAAMMPGEELIKLNRQSVPIHALMSYAQEFPGLQIDGLHVRRSWALAHPGAVKDLLLAQLHAHRTVRANPQVLFDQSQKRLNIDAPVRAPSVNRTFA